MTHILTHFELQLITTAGLAGAAAALGWSVVSYGAPRAGGRVWRRLRAKRSSR